MLDLVLEGGTVVDGSGGPGFRADVGVAGERIAAVGTGLSGAVTVDCSGHVVCPGFIDTHSHSDVKVLADPILPMKVRQGITLEVLGQDGISVAPVRPAEREGWKQKLSGLLGDFGVAWDWSSVAEYLRRVALARPAQDVAYLAPHGAIRQWVMGGGDRRASEGEAAAMQELLRRSLAEARRPLVVHMRSESDRILEAAGEMIQVAEASGCAVQISHLKIAGQENWGRAEDLVALVEEARRRGLRVTADQYPYEAGSTLLGALLPPWAHDGGTEATLSRLRDPLARARMRSTMADTGASDWDNFWKWSGPEGIVVADVPSGRHPEWIGRTLAEVAASDGKDPFETAFDLLLKERMGVAMISLSQDEAVVDRFLRLPWACVCTDGLLGGRPHPRAYGAYPRVLGRYVRERRTLTLEEAVRKMTSQAASAFGLEGVGLVREGCRANLVVFDPDTVADRATFEDPARFPVGLRDVFVGGVDVVRDEEPTGRRGGRLWPS